VKPRILAVALAALVATLVFGPRSGPDVRAAEEAAAPALFGEPSLSPDGSEIAFVSGGDIWTVPTAGGAARLLVSDPGTEARPLHSPDGRHLAFTSTRAGGAPEVYVLSLEGGAVRRLTYDDGPKTVDGWSPDGRWLYFSTSGHDISRMNDVYRVAVEGGTPIPVVSGAYVNESMVAPSPDGQMLAFVGRGFAQWWRRGSSHIDQSALWLRRDGRPARYERLTDGAARDSWPCGRRTGAGSISSPTGAGPRTSGTGRWRERPAPSRRSVTGGWSGPPSPPAPPASRSSATSPSGPSTPRAGRRPRSPSPCAERRRGAPSSTCP
jgi:dipeptidyl aminopeptidase/acylaminoacyl peptidase